MNKISMEYFAGETIEPYAQRHKIKSSLLWNVLIHLWIDNFSDAQLIGNRRHLIQECATMQDELYVNDFRDYYFQRGQDRLDIITSGLPYHPTKINLYYGRTPQEVEQIFIQFKDLAREHLKQIELNTEVVSEYTHALQQLNSETTDHHLINLAYVYLIDFTADHYIMNRKFADYLSKKRPTQRFVYHKDSILSSSHVDVVVYDKDTNELISLIYTESIYHRESPYFISPSVKYQNELKKIQTRLGVKVNTFYVKGDGSYDYYEDTIQLMQSLNPVQPNQPTQVSKPITQTRAIFTSSQRSKPASRQTLRGKPIFLSAYK